MRTDSDGVEQRRLQLVTRMADDALRSAGIDPTPRRDAPPGSDAAQAARFHRAVQDEVSVLESRGRALTEEEVLGIVNGLKDTGIKGGWLKVRDTSLTVLSDFSPDEAFHVPGAELAQAGPTAPPEQGQQMWLTLDFDRMRRDREEREQREADEQAATGTGGAAGAPATEPYPGSPEYQAAEEEARKLDAGAWENRGVFGQLGIAFERSNEEMKKRGATFNADSAARRLETVAEFQRRQANGEELNVTEKRYLLKNRNVTSDLAGAVTRLIDAQHRLDELPMSDPLRRLFEASSASEVGRLLRENPGEIARAIGIESVPALTVSLITMAALGPVGGAVTLTGTSGLDGYAKGLVGALARVGVDVSNADALTRALQDKTLMEQVRKDATTAGAIEAGVTAAAMMIGSRIGKPAMVNSKLRIPGFSDLESQVLHEARTIYRSPEFKELRAAFAAGKQAEVTVNGRPVVYVPHPNLEYRGMSLLSTDNGFIVFTGAFHSESELGRTIIHELQRLSSGKLGIAEAGSYVRNATDDAFNLAAKGVSYVIGD